MGRETDSNFMNGVPELLILKLLGQGDMYGYEIVQAIRNRTGEAIADRGGRGLSRVARFGTGGALTSRRKMVNGRSRVYYMVTPAGLRRFAERAQAWTDLSSAIQKVLTGG